MIRLIRAVRRWWTAPRCETCRHRITRGALDLTTPDLTTPSTYRHRTCATRKPA